MLTNLYLSPTRGTPRTDELTFQFFAGLREGKLLMQICDHCGTGQLGKYNCFSCQSQSLRWISASGKGRLYSYALICANSNLEFNHGEPYNIAIVELNEGPQLYTNIVNIDQDALCIGMSVQVIYSQLECGDVVPVFEPEMAPSSR